MSTFVSLLQKASFFSFFLSESGAKQTVIDLKEIVTDDVVELLADVRVSDL